MALRPGLSLFNKAIHKFLLTLHFIIDFMKKILLLAAAALMVTSANAQLARSQSTHAPARPNVQTYKPEAKKEVAHMRIPGTPVVKAPKKAANVDLWYDRPAGAFPASMVVEDGAYAGLLYAPYIAIKPYVDYTFKGHAVGQSANATYEWDVQYWDINPETGEEEQMWATVPGSGESGMDLTWNWGYETDSVPVFYVIDGEDFFMWNLQGYQMGGTSDKPSIEATYSSSILSVPSTMAIWDTDFLKSSKNFCYGGRNGDKRYPMTYITGAEPYGDNEDGYWFGKNAGTGNYRVDGIAQAFEKPTAPYVLNYVALDATDLVVADGAQVEMTCKIYKLEDGIPPYSDEDEAVLPDEPGELIAKGRAIVTSETEATTGGLIFFTLYGEEDGLEYDITPTIDCAILVAIDGYNDPEMDDLQSFSAMISSDTQIDEGFGELAYLKFGLPDEDGNLDHYVWAGLNNFFTSGAMKTGLTIFLSTENPYLTFNWNAEDGEYTFPNEGGEMKQEFGDASIEFWSWEPYGNDSWYVSCNDEDVPEWLDIQLEDKMEGEEFSGVVMCNVTAQPLPAGVKYREAIVRFEFPGAYVDYKFMQGVKDNIPDVNHDGAVNIGDINEVIDMILSGRFNTDGDVNHDDAVNIGDINYLIDYILKH